MSISAIIPAFEVEATIGRAIRSLQDQVHGANPPRELRPPGGLFAYLLHLLRRPAIFGQAARQRVQALQGVLRVQRSAGLRPGSGRAPGWDRSS